MEMFKVAKKAVIICPNKVSSKEVEDAIKNEITECKIFNAKEIELSKEAFINSNYGIVILANRYEGIDFPDDECRLLILWDFQLHLDQQEKFLVGKFESNHFIQPRKVVRITQAIGRCTRSERDRSVVCVVGDSLHAELLHAGKRILYHPEIQAELEFGLAQDGDR